MNYRRWSRVFEWSIAAVVICVYAALFLLPINAVPTPIEDFHDSVAICLVVLAVAWGMAGPGRWWLRVLGPAALVTLAWLFPRRYIFPESDLPAFVAGLAGASAIALMTARLCGIRAMRLSPNRASERRPQFSILSLLMVTTLIAATIAVLESLRPLIADQYNPIDSIVSVYTLLRTKWEDTWISAGTVRVLLLSTFIAGIALGAIGVVLRPGTVWLRLAMLALAIPSISAYLLHLVGISGELTIQRTAELAIGFSSVAILTMLTVLPLRLFGYRLMRPASARRQLAVPEAPDEPLPDAPLAPLKEALS